MKICKGCKYFKIIQQPLRVGEDIYDYGMAKCKKHDLVIDFSSMRKVNRLSCADMRGNDNG